MWDGCRLIWSLLIGLFRSRATLEAENLILRQQIVVLRRTAPKRLSFNAFHRMILVGLYCFRMCSLGWRSLARDRGSLASCGMHRSKEHHASTRGAGALNVLSSPMLFLNRRVIIERAAELRLPSVYQWPEMAEEGGLLGYGPRFVDVFRQRARMVAKILSGAKPADLPVEQPTTFELVINLKTAKAIGHEVPAGLVLRADKVIE